jgi:parallel beta-helix repeat protein
MKASKVMFLVFLSLLTLSVVSIQTVRPQQNQLIYITAEGDVNPDTAPIQRVGDVYTLTDNIVGYTIVVQRNNIEIDGAGYALSGQGGAGIDLSSRSNVIVRNTQFFGYFQAIFLWSSVGNTITGNTFTSNGYSIFLAESSDNTITGNTLTNNEYGIAFESSTNNTARNNNLSSKYNLAVYGSENSHFVNDVDTSNTVNDKRAYYLIGEANLVIDPSTYPDVGFLALVNCQNITVQNLDLAGNGQGVIMAFTKGTSIIENDIQNNYIGVGLFASYGNYIIANNIANNFRGVQLSGTSNINGITTNIIDNNVEGIFIFDSTQNTVSANNVTNSDQIGIGFKTSSNNIIRSNFFVSNGRQVYDAYMDDSTVTVSTNLWDLDFPVGGNYWSDYMGVDLYSGANRDQPGGDGLGDTPYIIYEGNQDDYPLLPYGSPPAISIDSPENRTYSVTSVSLSFTVNEETTWIAYSLDGQANVEISGTTTLSGLSVGSHSVTVYARDADDLQNAAKVYFTIAEGATSPDAFPLIYIVPIVVAVVAVVLLFYFFKIRKKR